MEQNEKTKKFEAIGLYIEKSTGQIRYERVGLTEVKFMLDCINDTDRIPLCYYQRWDKTFKPLHKLNLINNEELLNIFTNDSETTQETLKDLQKKDNLLNKKIEAYVVALDNIFLEVDILQKEFPNVEIFNRTFVDIYKLNHRL